MSEDQELVALSRPLPSYSAAQCLRRHARCATIPITRLDTVLDLTLILDAELLAESAAVSDDQVAVGTDSDDAERA